MMRGMNTYAQLQRSTTLPGAPGKGTIVVFPRGIRQSSGQVSYLLAADTGNNIRMIPVFPDKLYDTGVWHQPPHKPFLVVHGNVMYDYYYQGKIDTPYQQKDVYQHTLSTWMDLTIRDQYPVHVTFSTTQGNSSLFRNITGFSIQYTNRDFRNLLIQKLKSWDVSRIKQLKELMDEKALLDAKEKELSQLKSWLSSPAVLQRLVEAKEKELYGKHNDSLSGIPVIPSIPSINLRYKAGIREPCSNRLLSDTSIESQYTARQQQLDSLQKRWQQMDSSYHAHQLQVGNLKGDMVQKISASRNNAELSAQLNSMNLPDSVLPKGYKTLLAIRKLSIGRALADYSELTAKSISIQGIQVEYNPRYYVAFAAGTIDYRFRNYVVYNGSPGQYLTMIRGGYGMKEGNHLYVSFFRGKKQLYNQRTGTDSTTPDYNIMGMAVESRWQISKNVYVTGEVAKSSLPYYQITDDDTKVRSMLRFSEHRNLAYSLSANGLITKTHTKLTGVYKVLGAGFQSFSLYTTGAKQIAWSVRVDQPFFKKKLMITASVRRNDYNTSYQQANYQSNTIYKTIQATLSIKHFPVFSLGYYPSSQLTKLSDGSYIENTFYTMVGTVSHFYKIKRIMMNTLLSYTRFYNKMDDSSYVYYNTNSILLNHTMFLGRFTVQSTGSAAMNGEYDLYGANGSVQFKAFKWLEIGGGLKYSYQSVYDLSKVGYTGNFRVMIPYLGQLEMMADKGFIPGTEKKLVSNNTGRLTYTKTF
ncbi:hypothetical protein [Chitinophaga sp. LS1]|uniref:hypothetical protein n=1 Tax=Chitinophaga sp. LS1 TaxID=3051176 RepID=UPI002AAB3832|nr:hypothetical protein [Chitinophaga sp. LS1]WPV66727.1 hypothetical protein QQL36_33570 [Chitinophaga sp. LS1]